MNIEKFAQKIAELHYPNKPNAIIDEPFRVARMNTLKRQIAEEYNLIIGGVGVELKEEGEIEIDSLIELDKYVKKNNKEIEGARIKGFIDGYIKGRKY